MSTNIQLEHMIKVLKIKHYRGYYSKDELFKIKPIKQECLLVNLQDHNYPGSHHLALWKNGEDVRYFDSYGCPIPKEIEEYYSNHHVQYFRSNDNKFPDKILQPLGSNICGELCVLFLFLCQRGYSCNEIISMLI
jgi:hypothetical protein